MEVQSRVSLKSLHTFGMDVYASNYAELHAIGEIPEVLDYLKSNPEPLLIMGGGSNMLFRNDYNGLVLRNCLRGIRIVREEAHHIWVESMAGECWHDLVMFAVKHNYGGIENLSLIPGCCGAAPMQNIGAYGVELKDVFESLTAIDLRDGSSRIFSAVDCEFGYRESFFKKTEGKNYIIISITLRLTKNSHSFKTKYGDIQNTLSEMGVNEFSIKAISDAVIKIRQSKLPDPKELGNAGSFFKNPEIPDAQFAALKEKFPLIPGYPGTRIGYTKVAAGWLIEQCEWKGKRVGETGSHARQALVLVNYGNATGSEVAQLANDIISSVVDRFGIRLNPEVNII